MRRTRAIRLLGAPLNLPPITILPSDWMTIPRIGRGEKPDGTKPDPLKPVSREPSEFSRATHGALTPSTLTKSPAIIILPWPSTTGSAQSPQPTPPIGFDGQVIVTGVNPGSNCPFDSSLTTP